ncbi:MAG: DNA translocase FtsK [Muribaculaceae bacterium]|nr:DNA translocase FtsK [Muribaculaceae bacterium]
MSYPENNEYKDSFEMPDSIGQSSSIATSDRSMAQRKRVKRSQTQQTVQWQAASPTANPRLHRQPSNHTQSIPYSEPEYDTDSSYDRPTEEYSAHNTPPYDVYEEETYEPKAPDTPRPKPRRKPKPEPKEVDGPGMAERFLNMFTNGRLGIFVGVVLLLVAAYMLITTLSYISTGSADQNLVENNTLEQLSGRSDSVSNTGGPFGAMLSYLLISRWLGVGSFIVIFYLIMLSLSLLQIKKFNFWNLTFKSLVSAISASILVGAATYSTASPTFWGGEHGYFVNKFFLTNTGLWGDIAINILMLTAVALIFFDTLKKLFTLIYEHFERYKMSLEQHRQKAASAIEEYDYEQDESAPTQQDADASQSATESSAANGVKSIFTNLKNRISENTASEMNVEQESTPSSSDDTTATADQDTEQKSATETEMDIVVNTIDQAEKIVTDTYDPTAELSRYRLPSLDLLNEVAQKSYSIDQQEQEMNKERITRTLNSYGIEISRISATVGPTITLYEIVPAEGVRIAKIKRLGDDMAMSLSALGIRIIAPMPGKGTIGMEVPNREKQIVSIRNILSSRAYQESKAELPMAMGSTIDNQVYIEDLCKMPHLLVAGATGMGKSVGLNTIIASLLYKKHPAELKFVLIDPKVVEFSLYSCLERHFIAKLPDEEDAIITDHSKVVATLNSLCVEMENRYEMLKNAGVRDIKSYNNKFIARRLNPEKGHRFLPYIVVIVDEFADLMLTVGKEVETPISRIAAKARAVGIHMILATQRPSVNVITGTIKANFPGRIAFRVMQTVDSRTIIDRPGAEQLIGRGDMLFSTGGIINRVQCALIETEEVERICEFISDQIGYSTAYELPEYIPANEGKSGAGGLSASDRDTLFDEAGRYVIETGIGSTTSIQRHFNVGYPRAGKIMDQLQNAGVVGPSQGGKPRNVLMDIVTFDQLVAQS